VIVLFIQVFGYSPVYAATSIGMMIGVAYVVMKGRKMRSVRQRETNSGESLLQ